MPLPPFPGFVFAEPERPGCGGTLRVDEDASNAQGFYIALLRKPGAPETAPTLSESIRSTASYRPLPPAFLKDFGMSPELLPPGELGIFEGSLRFRVLLDPAPSRIPRLDLDDTAQLERLLQGVSFDTGLAGKEASLFWHGLPLGRLRLKNGRALWSEK